MSSEAVSALFSTLPARHPWYGVRTKSNQEKIAATMLEAKGLDPYLPVYTVRRRWSDRIVETTLPLFPGYVFCRFGLNQKLPVVSTPGVVSIVGFGNTPAPIDDGQIEAIRRLIASGNGLHPHAYLHEGQRVRVKDGALEGLEGILVKKRSEWRMVVSVTLLQRSISVEVDRECLAEA